MERSEIVARDLDVEMVSDDEKSKQDVAHLEPHGETCLLTASDQGGVLRQDTRDGSSLWTGHYPREAKGLENQAHYIRWQTDHLGKEFDRSGTDGGTTMDEYSSSPTETSTAAGQQQSHRHGSEEETPMDSTKVRFLHGTSKTGETPSTAVQSSESQSSANIRLTSIAEKTQLTQMTNTPQIHQLCIPYHTCEKFLDFFAHN